MKFLITVKSKIQQETIKNLLFAQRRIAEGGNVKDMIRITKFLFRLAEQCGDVLKDIITEGNEDGR